MKQATVKLAAILLAFAMLAGCAPQMPPDAEGTPSSDQTITSNDGAGVNVGLNQTDEEREALIAAHTDEQGRTCVSVAVEADPGTLTPYGSGVGKVQHVIRNALFETAMVLLTDGSLQPYLATGYEQVDDVTYDVFFKDYIYDTEGNHLTAEDVVFSWYTGRDVWKAANISFMEECEAIDTYTVRIKMVSPQAGTFEKILYEGWIFTQAAYENSPDEMITTPVGTSNYRLVKWETGSEVIIEKTNNYWEKDENNMQIIQVANVDVITYKIITEEAQRIISLQTGEVDMIHKVDFTNLDTFSGDNYSTFSTMNNQIITMMFNCSENSPCGDVRVRQAVCYAIDAAGILDVVCSGQGEVAWVVGTSGSADAYEVWKSRDNYGLDVDKAVALLEEAGYNSSNPLTLKCMYETTDKNAPTAEVVQAYLGNVGITVEMLPCEGATYSTYKYTSTEFDFHLGALGGLEPYCVDGWWAFRGTGIDDTGNVIALDDAHMTELLEACRNTSTHDEEHMTAALDYMQENAFVYPLYRYMLYTVTTNIFTTMNLRCGGREIAPQYCEYIWND